MANFKKVLLTLEEQSVKELDRRAKEKGLDRSALVRMILEEGLKAIERQGGIQTNILDLKR